MSAAGIALIRLPQGGAVARLLSARLVRGRVAAPTVTTPSPPLAPPPEMPEAAANPNCRMTHAPSTFLG